MEKIYIELLGYANYRGNLIETSLYKDGTYSTITFEKDGCVYKVSISKENASGAEANGNG